MSDTGAIDAALESALTDWAEGSGDRNAVIAALRSSRLLVPAVPNQDGTEVNSVIHESANGRRGFLAFTSVSALTAWDPAARPLPLAARDIAREILSRDLDGLLLDFGGRFAFAVVGIELYALAA